jgi:hypothetical protein
MEQLGYGLSRERGEIGHSTGDLSARDQDLEVKAKDEQASAGDVRSFQALLPDDILAQWHVVSVSQRLDAHCRLPVCLVGLQQLPQGTIA